MNTETLYEVFKIFLLVCFLPSLASYLVLEIGYHAFINSIFGNPKI